MTQNIPKMFLIVPRILSISWKVHDNLFLRFSYRNVTNRHPPPQKKKNKKIKK